MLVDVLVDRATEGASWTVYAMAGAFGLRSLIAMRASVLDRRGVERAVKPGAIAVGAALGLWVVGALRRDHTSIPTLMVGLVLVLNLFVATFLLARLRATTAHAGGSSRLDDSRLRSQLVRVDLIDAVLALLASLLILAEPGHV